MIWSMGYALSWLSIWALAYRLLSIGIARPCLLNDGNTTAALAAMTGICGFLWTGVLILKQLGLRYDNRLRIAGELLGYGFLAPLTAMVVTGSPIWLRGLGLLFFLAYTAFFLIPNVVRVLKSSRNDRRERRYYTVGQALYVIAMLAVVLWPYSLTILVSGFVLLFVGYQQILTKLLARTEEHERTFSLVLFAEMLEGGTRYLLHPRLMLKAVKAVDWAVLEVYVPENIMAPDSIPDSSEEREISGHSYVVFRFEYPKHIGPKSGTAWDFFQLPLHLAQPLGFKSHDILFAVHYSDDRFPSEGAAIATTLATPVWPVKVITREGDGKWPN
jgi:hypothetical protein